VGRILVHITHGPEQPTRAALGFLVAKAATEEGHEVTIPAEFAMPNVLVRLALEHDRVFTY
jgi:predicted peroxiredoxin